MYNYATSYTVRSGIFIVDGVTFILTITSMVTCIGLG